MLVRFDGPTAMVAGPERGIGQVIARSLASDGARVFACDLLVDEVVPIAGRLNGDGEIIAVKVDVTVETSIAEVIREPDGAADILVDVVGMPKDIVDAVPFMASDHASWTTGQTIAVIGARWGDAVVFRRNPNMGGRS